MTKVESLGTGSTTESSCRLSWAAALPSSCSTGSIVSTMPTRTPPMRTSLPSTREAASGTVAEIV